MHAECRRDFDEANKDRSAEEKRIEELTFRDRWLERKYDSESEKVKQQVLDFRQKLRDGLDESMVARYAHLSAEEAKPYIEMEWRVS